MKIEEVINLLNGKLVTTGNVSQIAETGFCSDLMSDVLTLDTEKMLLITGTANLQTIRTAEMGDIHSILLVRNKKATKEMIQLAEEAGIIIIETPFSSFKCCGLLYNSGLKPVY
ncbi:MAG: hypothetical protein KA807_06965 [Prolixibacteraceae bacterium]|nr:hypothetical protein [Prolixibacteraceae bacterium]